MKLSTVVLLILLNFSNVISDTYNVKYIKGVVEKNDEIVKIGSTLKNTDYIVVKKDSKIVMISKNNVTISVDKSGFYSILKLEDIANTKSTNVTKKFTKYILDELSDSEDLLASGNINNNMSTLGAVERAINNKLFFYDNISTYSIDDNHTFTWNYEGDVTFFIKNADNEILYKLTTSSNEIHVNLKNIGLDSGICYFFSITQGYNTSEEYCIYRMTEHELDIFKQEYLKLIYGIELNNPVDYLILAKFYETNRIINKVFSSYEKAIELDPNPLYKMMYKNYLIKIGLFEKAKKIKI